MATRSAWKCISGIVKWALWPRADMEFIPSANRYKRALPAVLSASIRGCAPSSHDGRSVQSKRMDREIKPSANVDCYEAKAWSASATLWLEDGWPGGPVKNNLYKFHVDGSDGVIPFTGKSALSILIFSSLRSVTAIPLFRRRWQVSSSASIFSPVRVVVPAIKFTTTS